MIHSFRRHGASPAARSTGDTKMRKNGTGLSSHRAALRQTHPLAPSSCAPPPARRPGTDSSSLSEGTCGTNKERGWPKGRRTPGAACGWCRGDPAAGKERGAPGWGGGERGGEGRGPRGGDSAPPPPGGELGGPRSSRAHEGRGSAPPTRPRRAPSRRLPPPPGSWVASPRGFLPGRSGISVPPPGAAREPGASAAAGSASPAPPYRGRAGRGWRSRSGRGAGGGGGGARGAWASRLASPLRTRARLLGLLCLPARGPPTEPPRSPPPPPVSFYAARGQPCLSPSHRRPHTPHPRELKAGRLLHVLLNIANIYGAPCKYQALCRGLALQRRPRQTTWI